MNEKAFCSFSSFILHPFASWWACMAGLSHGLSKQVMRQVYPIFVPIGAGGRARWRCA